MAKSKQELLDQISQLKNRIAELEQTAVNGNQTKIALAQSEEKFARAFDLTPVTLAIIDLDTKERISVNKYFAEVSGYSQETLMKHPLGALGEIDEEKVALAIKSIKAGTNLYGVEVKVKHTSGREYTMLYDAEGINVGNRRCMMVSGRDITKLRQAERGLERSENKFKKIFDLNPSMLTVSDIESGEFLEVNEAFLKQLGFDREEVIGKRSTDLGMFVDPSVRENLINMLKEKGSLIDQDIQFRRKTGSIWHGIFSAHIIEVDNRNAVLTTAVDLSDLKKSEEELRRIAASLTEAHRISKIGTGEFDISTKKMTWSDQMYNILEVSPDQEASFELYYSRVHPDDLAKVQETASKVFEDFEEITLDYRLLLPSGSIKIIHTESRVVYENDEVTKLHGIHQDITELKESEESIRKSEERLSAIVEAIPDLTIILDANGRYLDFFAPDPDMLGAPPEQILGKTIYEVMPIETAQAIHEVIKKALETGELQNYEYSLEIEGNKVFYAARVVKFRFQDTDCVLWGTRDITDQKMGEQERAQALIDAKVANEVKDQFIANISHEIRTPLNSILGFIQLIKANLSEQLGEDKQDYFNYIQKGSDRLLRTVHQILDISQFEAGVSTPPINKLELADIIEQVVHESMIQVKEKDLDLNFHSKVENSSINGDEYSVTQAISNIVENAIKYTRSGGIEITLDRKAGKHRVVVSDTGIGIGKEFMSNIFDPFSQESEGYTRSYQGLGLGLALTKRYLELNDAEIDIESTKNEGTKVTILFPQWGGGK